MTKEEIKTWIEEHKAWIIVIGKGVGVFALGVIIGRAIRKMSNVPMNVIYDMPPENIPELPKTPEIPMGLIRHGVSNWDTVNKGCLEFMLPYATGDTYPTKLSDLHEIIEALKDVPGITDDTDVWAQFSISRDNMQP
ncbi:MAG: hypothetical protein J6U54_01265 [Clostridiales bacterium]|nr:hypothetical protein [Clostridiales bacterium]